MTTKKNLVKSMLMSIATAGIFSFGLSSCNDDINEFDNHGFNAEINSYELQNLEQYSYTVPVKIDCQGAWKIDLKFSDDNNHFCYALPSEGVGPQTIKLCMLDNWTDSRNEAMMKIHDLSDSDNDKSFRLMQKCNLDNPAFARSCTRGGDVDSSNIQMMYHKGRRAMAVGYGYDATKVPGPDAVSLNPIIALDKLAGQGDDAGAKTMGCQSAFSIDTYKGNTYEELFQNVTMDANSKVTKGGLTAEVKASFTHEQKTSTQSMFVYTTVDANYTNAYLSGLTPNNIREFLTVNAKEAIDGVGKYATGDAGFKNLLNDFGSHLIMKSDLGGRLRYATTVSKSLTESKDSAYAYAKASYKNKVVEDAGVSVSATIAKNYKNNTERVKTSIKAQGGDITTISKSEDIDKWIESLKENLMCVGIGNDSKNLIPLYDLVDTSTEEGRQRREAMKQFFESGLAQVMAFDATENSQTTDVFHFTINDDLKSANGYAAKHNGSLVYEAWANGKVVAMICKEYMPQISNMGLVLTVYPVNNNKPDFMHGRFLGNDIRPASRITWTNDNNGKAILTADAEEFKMETEIYVRGGEIFTFKPICKRIVEAQVKGKYLKGQKAKSDCCVTFGETQSDKWHWNSDRLAFGRTYLNPWLEGLSYDDNYQYPLVKFGTRIWTRENFNGNVPHGKDKNERYGSKIEKGEAFFTYKSLKNASFPVKWHAGKAEDYKELRAVLTSDGVDTEFGERMQEGGASGFELKWTGWYTYDWLKQDFAYVNYSYFSYERKGNGTAAEYLLPGIGHVRIRANKFDVCPKETDDFAMQIRLVMD